MRRTRRRPRGRLGQLLAVHLAVRRQRHALQTDQHGRDHVLRQVLPQERAQSGLVGLVPPGDVPDDSPCHVLAGRDHGGPVHRGVPLEDRLDLAELDAVAADLDLGVLPADELQSAVGPPARQVTGAVEPVAGPERVRHEPLRREGGPPGVAAGDTRAADDEFADGADRHQPHPVVHHVRLGVGDRQTDRHRLPGSVRGDQLNGRVDAGLGGAVHVPQPGHPRRQLLGELRGERLAAGDGLDGAALPAAEQQQMPGGKRRRHDRRARLRHDPGQGGAVRGGLPVHQHHLGAPDERHEELQHRRVERHGGHRALHVVGGQAEGTADVRDEVHQAAVRDHHALG